MAFHQWPVRTGLLNYLKEFTGAPVTDHKRGHVTFRCPAKREFDRLIMSRDERDLLRMTAWCNGSMQVGALNPTGLAKLEATVAVFISRR